MRVHRLRDLSSRMRWISEDPYKHNPPPFADPEAAWRLRRVVKDFKPDLVHSYGWISHSVAVGLLGMKVPLPALGPRLRKRLRGGHFGPQGRALLGPGAWQVPRLRPRQLRSAEGRGRGGRRLRGRAGAAPQGQRRPRGQPLRRPDHGSLPARPGRAGDGDPELPRGGAGRAARPGDHERGCRRSPSSSSSAASARSRESTSCSRPTRASTSRPRWSWSGR